MKRSAPGRALLAASIWVLAPVAAVGGDTVPVMVGTFGEDIDACPSTGHLVRAAALRSAPDEAADEVTGLAAGTRVHACGGSADDRWLGVVLQMDGIFDCGVSSPVASPRPYPGPCLSGWVRSEDVAIDAG